MDFISGIVYSLLPNAVTDNPYFILGIALAYALLSCLQSFVKDPKFGWLAKYDDPIQTALGILGVWKKKSYSVMVQEQAKPTDTGGVVKDPLNADK